MTTRIAAISALLCLSVLSVSMSEASSNNQVVLTDKTGDAEPNADIGRVVLIFDENKRLSSARIEIAGQLEKSYGFAVLFNTSPNTKSDVDLVIFGVADSSTGEAVGAFGRLPHGSAGKIPAEIQSLNVLVFLPNDSFIFPNRFLVGAFSFTGNLDSPVVVDSVGAYQEIQLGSQMPFDTVAVGAVTALSCVSIVGAVYLMGRRKRVPSQMTREPPRQLESAPSVTSELGAEPLQTPVSTHEGLEYCVHCGARIASAALHCTECGRTHSRSQAAVFLVRLEQLRLRGEVSDETYERLKREYLEKTRTIGS